MRVLSDTAQQNKEKFKLFMLLIGLSESSIQTYANTVLSCSDLIIDQLHKDGFANLYEVTEQARVRYYQQLLEQNKSYICHNKTGNNRYMASIVNYVKYVDFLFIFSKA